MTPLEEIARLYYAATPRSIEHDLSRAVDLLKTLPNEDARERAAVYMDGLSQMRSEWAAASRGSRGARPTAVAPTRSKTAQPAQSSATVKPSAQPPVAATRGGKRASRAPQRPK